MKRSAHEGFKLSNLALLFIIGALGAGILLDGKLYNKLPPQNTIHALADAKSIELHFADQLILSFNKVEKKWLQTLPVAAPALTPRVQALLDTNKFTQRRYALTEVPESHVFKDPVTMKINQTEFEFGSIEPVSNLRYVRSGNYVYLQPDIVIPMLGAANNAFIDLSITSEVKQLTVAGAEKKQPQTWSNLKAIDIIDPTLTALENSIDIQLVQGKQTRELTAALSDIGYTIASDNGFTYLLDTVTAESLGLNDFLAAQ